MLLRVGEGEALAIGQLSHAWLSGQLARAWGNERFEAPDPREEVVLGAEQHDIGWALFDREPRFDPDTGLPRSFLRTTVAEHLAIWRGAPVRLTSQSLHAALVVSMHGRALSELRARNAPEQAPALAEHIAEEQARQKDLRATLGVSEAQAECTRRQMWTWDGLSLALCLSWQPFTTSNVPCEEGLCELALRDRGDGSWCLDPWPFSSARVAVRCEGRRLRGRSSDEAGMRSAFEGAERVTLEFVLLPA
jgi:hypothetical protein